MSQLVHQLIEEWGSWEATHALVDRKTGHKLEEPAPLSDAVSEWFWYGTPIGRLLLRFPITWTYLRWVHKRIADYANSPKSKKAIPWFIETYKIDIGAAEKPVEQYDTLQAFFRRRVKKELRPVAAPGDNTVAVMPADSRCVLFDEISTAHRLWFKGAAFTAPRLLGEPEGSPAARRWERCAIAVNRLSPTDCHRLHASVTGRVTRIASAGTRTMDSSWVATHSRLNVMTENERLIMEFDTQEFGRVVQVMVGASEVGSVVPLVKLGDTVTKGSEVAEFEYGGSIMATLFGEGAIAFDQDIMQHSRNSCEVLVAYGESLGRATGRPMLAPAGED